MKAYFYNFSKRKNSTKRPGTGTEYEIVIKRPSSVHNPVIQISAETFNYNYVYIPDFDSYFYISDVKTLANGLWEASLSVDVLATYRSKIYGTKAFVEYASNRYNTGVNDPRVSSIGTSTIFHRDVDAALFDTTGFYILSCVSTENNAKDGFAVYYILNGTQITNVANDFAGLSDSILDAIAKLCGSAYGSIISCKWLPFNHDTIAGNRGAIPSTGNVIIGNYGVTVIGSPYYVKDASPFHAATSIQSIWGSSSGIDRFKRVEPYCHINAYLPYYGTVSIPTLPVAAYDTLQFDYAVDFITGDVTCKISAGDGDEPLMTLNYNVAVDIPIAQVTDHSGSIATVISGLGAAALTGGGAVPAAVEAIQGSLQAVTVGTSVKGSISGRSYKAFGNTIHVTVEVLDTTDPNNLLDIQGRALMDVVNLSELSGYVKCSKASVSLPGLESDMESVNAALNSGIYLE